MKKYNISLFYFKQTIILFMVSFFLFGMTTVFHFGIIGVIVFIRALFMFKTEMQSFKEYSVKKDYNFYYIKRGLEEFKIPLSYITDIEEKENKLFNFFNLILKVKKENSEFTLFLPYLKK